MTNWKHIDSQTFHSKVESSLNANMPTTLRDLESMLLCCKNAAEKSRSSAPTLEPWQNPIIQTLIQERRGCRDKTQRAMLSKQIREHLRANMRQKRNKRLNDIVAEFRDLGYIATINDDPVRHQTKLSRAEPSKEEFFFSPLLFEPQKSRIFGLFYWAVSRHWTKRIGHSQLHCLQYFLLTRIECRWLRLVLVLHHSQEVSHFHWQKCDKQCSKCDVAVVQTEMVWCWWNCSNMALLVYMLVWCAFTMKYFAQDNLIHLGDTRCSQWFRKVGICNKPRTGGQ